MYHIINQGRAGRNREALQESDKSSKPEARQGHGNGQYEMKSFINIT